MISQTILKDSPYWDFIKTLAIVVGSISFIVFVALFGRLPIFRRTPIGWIHRALWIYIPNVFIKLDQVSTGGRVTRSLSRSFNYLMYERHPLVMIFFITLLLGSEVLFVPPAIALLPSSHSYIFIPLLVSFPYLTLYFCYTTSPAITPFNHQSSLNHYPYDYTLYHPHQTCRTCTHVKPARSKHCSICRTCVARHDHHCIWINNCVGAANYHYFMLLLISMMAILAYGALTGYSILNTVLQNRFVPPHLIAGSLSSKRWATGKSWTQFFDAWSWAIASNVRIGAVMLLSFMSFPLATGFLVYHVYLIWAGTTTNETGKWADLREDIYDDIVFCAKLRDVKMEYPAPMDGEMMRRERWPRRAEWWITRTRNGQHPTRRKWAAKEGEDGNAEEIDTRWIRVRNLKEVENLYDMGFWRNLKDAMFDRT